MTAPRRSRRVIGLWVVSLVGIASIAVALVLTLTDVIPPDPEGGPFTLFLYLLMEASFALVGAVLLTRVPTNRVGLILWIAGLALAIGVVGHVVPVQIYLAGGPTPGATALLLLSLAGIQVAFSLVMAVLPLVYPTGRPPSPRWRPVLWFAFAAIAFSIAKEVLAPRQLDVVYAVQNPIGLDALAGSWDTIETIDQIVLLTLIPASALSLVARYRAGAPIERQQVKWFAAVALVMVTCFAFAVLAPNEQLANLGWGLAILMLPFLPIAIGVAILRYRLYDLDRIISRTVSYLAVTGILVTTFALIIVALQGLLQPFTQGQTLAVAASTLVVFALFQPVRRRVQHAVDRRFDRARFDAERTTAAFSTRIRDEVDMATVTADLAATTRSALAPTAIAIWIREP